jgi:hypothetical protein
MAHDAPGFGQGVPPTERIGARWASHAIQPHYTALGLLTRLAMAGRRDEWVQEAFLMHRTAGKWPCQVLAAGFPWAGRRSVRWRRDACLALMRGTNSPGSENPHPGSWHGARTR